MGFKQIVKIRIVPLKQRGKFFCQPVHRLENKLGEWSSDFRPQYGDDGFRMSELH